MASLADIRFTLSADPAAATAAFKQVQAQAKASADGVQEAFGKLEKTFSGLQTTLAGLGIALGAALVKSTAEATEKTMDLARALALTTNEAAVLKAAMQDLGTTDGEYEAAAKGLVRQLAEQEEKMNALGLVTRDAAGNLRPLNDLMLDSIQVLGQYKEGTDRALASKQLFGRGIESSSRLLLYNREVLKENAAAVDELGLTVGVQAVAAWKEFDAASDRAQLGVQGFARGIGTALMPVATKMLEMFNSAMPAAITVARGAVGGLSAVFLGLADGINIAWQTMSAFMFSVAQVVGTIRTMMARVVTGDFKGVMEEAKIGASNLGTAWSYAFDQISARAVRTQAQLAAIFLPDTAASAKGSGGGLGKGSKNAPRKAEEEKKEAKPPAEPTYMATYEAALDQQRVSFAKANDLREMGKQAELAYWREVLAIYDVGSKDRTSITLKMSHLELEILRAARKDANTISTARADDWKAETLDYVAELEARATWEQTQNNTTQAQLLAQRSAYNAMRLQAELEFIAAKTEIAKQDPEANAVELEKLALEKHEVRRKYAALESGIQRDQVAEQQLAARNIAETVGNAFGNLTNTLLTSWKNLGASLRAVLADIGKSIIEETITKPLKLKIVAWAKERLLTVAGIGADAAKAASGAAASQAAIPVVGPPLAFAAMAAVFASVGALAGKVPSAAGGFDIPRGYNPLTQLHAEEMVLPAPLANAIRGMVGAGADTATGGPGGESAAPPQLVQINTRGGDFVHKGDLAALLKRMHVRHEFVGT